MKTHLLLACSLLAHATARAQLDLLQRYPTKLRAGDAVPERARPWEFTSDDIFRVSSFRLNVGDELGVDIGSADLGVGHCADGAIWAVVVPQEDGKLTSRVAEEETISHDNSNIPYFLIKHFA